MALPEALHRVVLEVPPGTTVLNAVERASASAELGVADPARVAFGVYGRRCPPDTLLADGDRVEIYRPLVADPKTLRRLRARQSAGEGALRPRSDR